MIFIPSIYFAFYFSRKTESEKWLPHPKSPGLHWYFAMSFSHDAGGTFL